MGLLLELSSNAKKQFCVLACDADCMDKLTQRYGEVTCMPVERTWGAGSMGASWILHESSIAMNGYTVTDIHLYCYLGKQEREEPKVEKISPYSASLGHISIRNFSESTVFPPADSWSIQLQDISGVYSPNSTRILSLNIIWNLKEEMTQSFTKYNIYVEKLDDQASTNVDGAVAGGKDFLGVARVECFYVSNLEVPVGSIGVKFIVQPCGPDGACQGLDDCPALVFSQ